MTPKGTLHYDKHMQANLVRVFNERDATKRLAAIKDLYCEDATLFEPESAVTGHQAINGAVTALLAGLPGLAFTPIGPASGHHDLGRLRWQSGPPGGPAVVTGMDVARFKGGLIETLHVFVEASGT